MVLMNQFDPLLSRPKFDAHISLKALSYFDDGDLLELSQDTKDYLLDAVSRVDLSAIPKLSFLRAAS